MPESTDAMVSSAFPGVSSWSVGDKHVSGQHSCLLDWVESCDKTFAFVLLKNLNKKRLEISPTDSYIYI